MNSKPYNELPKLKLYFASSIIEVFENLFPKYTVLKISHKTHPCTYHFACKLTEK